MGSDTQQANEAKSEPAIYRMVIGRKNQGREKRQMSLDE